MEESKKAAQKVAADASNAVGNTLKGVENAAGQGLKDAGAVVNEKSDTLAKNFSTAAHDGADGAAGLLNKGLSAFK
ncbi:unnamed protein product [Colias eurytheme]|nr:unnamed protein product [Colias eurytheme]